MTETVTIPSADAELIHQHMVDAAESWDYYDGNHSLDTDATRAARALAAALGHDPATVTDPTKVPRFPHPFTPGPADLDADRRLTDRSQGRWRYQTPETDEEVIARLGGRPETICFAGDHHDGHRRYCGKPEADPIHATGSVAAEMGE